MSTLQSITDPCVKSAFIRTVNINVDELDFNPLLALYDSIEDEEDSEDDEELLDKQSVEDAIIKFTEEKINIDGTTVSGSTFPIARKLDTSGLIDLPANPTVQPRDPESAKEFGDSILQRTNNYGMGVVGQISLNELRQRHDDHAYGAESIRVAEDERIVGELLAQCDARSKVNELLKSESEIKPVCDIDPKVIINMRKNSMMHKVSLSPQMFYYDGKDNVIECSRLH